MAAGMQNIASRRFFYLNIFHLFNYPLPLIKPVKIAIHKTLLALKQWFSISLSSNNVQKKGRFGERSSRHAALVSTCM
jgi:hypothetical protein